MLRLFVVGCSRSGTSIVQKVLAEELALWTLPETGFFKRNLNTFYGRVSALCGIYYAANNRTLQSRVIDPLKAIVYLAGVVPLGTMIRALGSAPAAAALFQYYFDREAERHGSAGWLEKTPKHFQSMDDIRRYVTGPRFVFVVRNGEDVVASIRDRYRQRPDRFPDEGDPLYGVNLWNESMARAIENEQQQDVVVLCYEKFVNRQAEMVTGIRERFGLPAAASTRKPGAAVSVARHHETWKGKVHEAVAAQASKFDQQFDEAEKALIRARLNMREYHRLCANTVQGN